MIYVIATLTIKPGSADALRAPAAACMTETRKEEGCLAYDLHQSFTDPDKLVFVEQWESRQALSIHSKTEHLKAWRDASAPHLIERRIRIIHPEKIEDF